MPGKRLFHNKKGEVMIQPLRDQVLIEKTEPHNVSKGGIILPESRAMGLYAWGIVKAVGPRVRHLKVGDRCRYTKLMAWPLEDGMALIKEEIADCVDV